MKVSELYQRATARRNVADCLGEETLMRVACGEASRDERERVVAHLASCSDCAREYQIARSLRPLHTSRRPQRLVWSLAAMLALALGAVVWMGMQLSERGRPGRWSGGVPPPIVGRRDGARPAGETPALHVQFGMPIIDLDADATRGASHETTKIAVPGDLYTLILHLPVGWDGAIDVAIDDAAAMQTTASAGSVTVTLRKKIGAHVIHVRSSKRQLDFPFSVVEK